MEPATKSKIAELQAVMTKMSLEVCCVAALPEFGVKWREVSKAVRNARLPMTSASVARVICRHVAKALPAEEVDDVLARLRLKLVASQRRTWHVVRLGGAAGEAAPALARRLAPRVRDALRDRRGGNLTPEVHTVQMGELIYASVRLAGAARAGAALYCAHAPGLPAALVSSLAARGLLRAVVAGLGYKEYTDAQLHGSDIPSLLRLEAGAAAGGPAARYRPGVARARGGLDYTGRAYDQQYLDAVLGPDPPLLTHLNITSSRSFFDASRLDKQMRLVADLRSADVSRSLRAWVARGALAPTSDLFNIYHQIKANKITYTREDSD